MNTSEELSERILEVLSSSVWGLSIEEIAKMVGAHRNTVSRYLKKLENLGLVVKKTVGKYSFWLSRSIYNYYKTDAVRLFIEALINFFIEKGFSSEDIGEAGREIANYLLNKVKENIELSNILTKGSNAVSDFFNLYIPTLIPRLRIRISVSDFSKNLVLVYFDGCPTGVRDFIHVCSFFSGFIMGFLDAFKIGYKTVEVIEMDKSRGVCKFGIILEKPLKEILF